MITLINQPRRGSLALASLFVLAFVSHLPAATYYVATNGNDNNPGTSEQPFATVNKGATVATAGDTVIIRSGTYSPSTRITVANSGTSTAPITFKAEVKHGAVIDGRSQVPNMTVDGRVGLFEMINKSWIIVDGLRVINSGFWGIWMNVCQNMTIRNCSTYNTYGSGILATEAGSYNINIIDNVVQRACMYPDISVNTSECITVASVDTFEIAGNVVHDRPVDVSNGGEGIDAKNSCTNGKIHSNVVFDLARVGIYVDAYSADLSGVSVYANLVYNCKAGIRVASESRGTVTNVSVHDNVVRDITKAEGIGIRGYLSQGPIKDVFIYQNTIVRAGNTSPTSTWENCAILCDSDHRNDANLVVRNNILYSVAANANGPHMRIVNPSDLTIDRNLFHGPAQSTVTGTNAIFADPLFVNAAGSDFHLQAGSPAIDAVLGAPLSTLDFDGIPRPVGSAGDLGAFERTSSTPPPQAPGGLTAISGDQQVSLAWSATTGATSYTVKRATVSGGPYTTRASGVTTTSYNDTGLTNGTTYYYVVSASNAYGESPNSSEVSATPLAPPVLLSQGMPATASAFGVGYEPGKATDGDLLNTRWGASTKGFPQWWRVDLGASRSLRQVVINWYSAASRSYKYRIEVSNDGVNFTTAVDKTANTVKGNSTDSFTANGRYVRVTVTGCSDQTGQASFYECRVYGN